MSAGKLEAFEERLIDRANELSRSPDGPLDTRADSQVPVFKVAFLDVGAVVVHIVRKLTGDLSQQGE